MSEYPTLSKRKIMSVLLVCGIMSLSLLVPAAWATPTQNAQRQSIPTLTATPTVFNATPVTPDASPQPPATAGVPTQPVEAATWDVVTAPPPAEEAPGEPVAPGEEQSEGTPIPFLMPTEDGSLQVAGTTPAAAFVPTSLPSATAFDSTLLTPTGTVSPSPVADRAAAASTFIVATGGLMVIAVGLILVWRQSHDPDST